MNPIKGHNAYSRRLAWKLWVELGTRKVAQPINLEHDRLDKIYASWHEAFKNIRQILRDAEFDPGDRETTQTVGWVIRRGLEAQFNMRLHLTYWAPGYLDWLESEDYRMNLVAYNGSVVKAQREFPRSADFEGSLMNANKALGWIANQLADYMTGKRARSFYDNGDFNTHPLLTDAAEAEEA